MWRHRSSQRPGPQRHRARQRELRRFDCLAACGAPVRNQQDSRLRFCFPEFGRHTHNRAADVARIAGGKVCDQLRQIGPMRIAIESANIEHIILAQFSERSRISERLERGREA